MNTNERLRSYLAQRGVNAAGCTKNATTMRRATSKLTPAQRRRLTKKGL